VVGRAREPSSAPTPLSPLPHPSPQADDVSGEYVIGSDPSKKRRRKPENPVRYGPAGEGEGRRVKGRQVGGGAGRPSNMSPLSEGSNSGARGFDGPSASPHPGPQVSGFIVPIGQATAPAVLAPLPRAAVAVPPTLPPAVARVAAQAVSPSAVRVAADSPARPQGATATVPSPSKSKGREAAVVGSSVAVVATAKNNSGALDSWVQRSAGQTAAAAAGGGSGQRGGGGMPMPPPPPPAASGRAAEAPPAVTPPSAPVAPKLPAGSGASAKPSLDTALAAKLARLETDKVLLLAERERAAEKLSAAEGERDALKAARDATALALVPLLVQLNKVDAAEKRRALAEMQSKVGRWDPRGRTGLHGTTAYQMEFSPGSEWRAAESEKASLEEKIRDLDARLALVRKKKGSRTKASKAAAAGASKGRKKAAAEAEDEEGEGDGEGEGEEGGEGGAGAAVRSPGDIYTELELLEDEERIKVALVTSKRDLEGVKERRLSMERDALFIQAELVRQRREDESKLFLKLLPSTSRYLLTQMLGKGGNGEVWKAIDLHTGREVAVKMNMMDPNWNDLKREHYVRHVLRETDIMKALKHPNIVEYVDTVHVSEDCLAMVMELCTGEPLDLDKMLKTGPGCLAEREARAILLQILSALRYMSGIYSSTTEAAAGGAGGGGGGRPAPPPRHPLRPQARKHPVRRVRHGQGGGFWAEQDHRGEQRG